MEAVGNKIKDLKDILSSIDRIAYQIYESNFEEEIIYVVGIGKKGKTLSALIGKSLSSISDLEVQFITLEVDKKNPLNNINSDIAIDELKSSSIVVVDDVLNTGSTLIYAVSLFTLMLSPNLLSSDTCIKRFSKIVSFICDFPLLILIRDINWA